MTRQPWDHGAVRSMTMGLSSVWALRNVSSDQSNQRTFSSGKNRSYTFALQMAQPPCPQLQRGPLMPRSWAAPRLSPKTVYCLVTFFPPHFAQETFCLSDRTRTSNRCPHFPQRYSYVGMGIDSMGEPRFF